MLIAKRLEQVFSYTLPYPGVFSRNAIA